MESPVTMGYPWLTIVHVAHDVASMPESVLKGRWWGSSFNFTDVWLFCFPFLLLARVARCQSTSSRARRRFDLRPTHEPAK